jgi:Galactose-3-O-sulfotransferase
VKINFNPALTVDKDRTLLFLHIPKTGGMTLDSIIERQYPARNVFSIGGDRPDVSIRYFQDLPENERARVRCLEGHMHFGLHKDIPGPCVYITMLRHPVDRVISHYHHALRHPKHYLHQDVVNKKMSIEDYVKHANTWELSNGQARLLGGVTSDPLPSNFGERIGENLNKHFAAVGLMERFDESLLLFKELLGWKNIYYIKENVSAERTQKKEIPAQTVKVIEEANQLDLELYRDAAAAFDEMIRRYGITPERLAEFRSRNRLQSTVLRVKALRLMKSIEKKFSSGSPLHGGQVPK